MFSLFIIAPLVTLAAGLEGAPRLDGRVMGGHPVEIEEYPYQVSLQHFGSHACGATVIAERYVLTAAHCTIGMKENEMTIRAGSSYHASGGVVVGVATIHQHDHYNDDTMENDISVLELSESLRFSAGIQPAQLASANPVDGAKMIVTGWGRTASGNPEQLHAAELNIVNHESCVQAYKGINDITDDMFCAAAEQKDACQGDSGGPLVGDGVLVGVTSWGYGCAQPPYPGVYTSVANMRQFIYEFAHV